MSQVTVSTVNPRKRKLPTGPVYGSMAKKARNSGTTAVNRIPRTLRSFPKTQRVKLLYSQIADLSITAGSPVGVVLRANGPYDPDVNAGGQQPRGFTQWSAFYERYTCVASKVHFRLLDKDTGTGTTGTVTGLYGVTLLDNTSFVTDVKTLLEDDETKYSGYDSYHAAAKIVNKVNVAKYFTVKDILDDPTLAGNTGTTLVGTPPTKQIYWRCWATQAPSSGAAAQTFVADILVEYDIIFTDPKDLPAS